MPTPSAINQFNLCAAIGEGYMAAEGVTVKVISADGSQAVLLGLVSGQAQIGVTGPGPVLIAHEQGSSTVMFYNQFSLSVFGLVVPQEFRG